MEAGRGVWQRAVLMGTGLAAVGVVSAFGLGQARVRRQMNNEVRERMIRSLKEGDSGAPIRQKKGHAKFIAAAG